MRELFIYWRTEAAMADAAERALVDWQARLRQAHPGLRALLYRRAEVAGDTASGMATLMETYAGTGGALAEALERCILDEGDVVAGPWIRGERKVETFVRCAGD